MLEEDLKLSLFELKEESVEFFSNVFFLFGVSNLVKLLYDNCLAVFLYEFFFVISLSGKHEFVSEVLNKSNLFFDKSKNALPLLSV